MSDPQGAKAAPDETVFKDQLSTTKLDVSKSPDALRRAILIHNQTMVAVSNFHRLYVESHKIDPEAAGHGDQDLLRAMLLFSCSGLDAVVKQLIQDALETVLKHDEGAQREFKKFAERRLKKASPAEERERLLLGQNSPDVAFLAELFVSFDPRAP
jgi:hypothetical protein